MEKFIWKAWRLTILFVPPILMERFSGGSMEQIPTLGEIIQLVKSLEHGENTTHLWADWRTVAARMKPLLLTRKDQTDLFPPMVEAIRARQLVPDQVWRRVLVLEAKEKQEEATVLLVIAARKTQANLERRIAELGHAPERAMWGKILKEVSRLLQNGPYGESGIAELDRIRAHVRELRRPPAAPRKAKPVTKKNRRVVS